MDTDIIGKEFIFTNKKYQQRVFVFWKDLKKRIIFSESQYKEFIRSYRLLKNESIKIKILKKEEMFGNFYLCELIFPDSEKIETLWATKEIISIWLNGDTT